MYRCTVTCNPDNILLKNFNLISMAIYPYTQETALPIGIKITTKVSLQSGMLVAEVLFSNAGGPIVSFIFPNRSPFPITEQRGELSLMIKNVTLSAPSGKNPGRVLFDGHVNLFAVNQEIASWI